MCGSRDIAGNDKVIEAYLGKEYIFRGVK